MGICPFGCLQFFHANKFLSLSLFGKNMCKNSIYPVLHHSQADLADTRSQLSPKRPDLAQCLLVESSE